MFCFADRDNQGVNPIMDTNSNSESYPGYAVRQQAMHVKWYLPLRIGIITALIFAVIFTAMLCFAPHPDAKPEAIPTACVLGIFLSLGVGVCMVLGCRKKSFGFKCPECGKHLTDQTPWVCGFCDGENINPAEHSFLQECKHCETPPQAFQCYHCGKPVFFDASRDSRHCAYKIPLPQPGETQEQAKARRKNEREALRTEHEEKLESIRRETQLLEELAKKHVVEQRLKAVMTPKDNDAVSKIRNNARERIAQYRAKIQGTVEWLAAQDALRKELQKMPEFQELPESIRQNLLDNIIDDMAEHSITEEQRLSI